jgi:hypothetical protein
VSPVHVEKGVLEGAEFGDLLSIEPDESHIVPLEVLQVIYVTHLALLTRGDVMSH